MQQERLLGIGGKEGIRDGERVGEGPLLLCLRVPMVGCVMWWLGWMRVVSGVCLMRWWRLRW